MNKRRALILFALLSAAGIVVIALPDSGPRLALSAAHGPGALDTAGIVLLLAGSSLLWGYLWKSRPSLHAAAARLRAMWTFGAGLGIGLILASVLNDFTGWWVLGAGLLAALQFSLVASARSPHD